MDPDSCCLQRYQFFCCTRTGFCVYRKNVTGYLLDVLYIYAESNRSQIACVMLVTHPEWARIEISQNRFESELKKISSHTSIL